MKNEEEKVDIRAPIAQRKVIIVRRQDLEQQPIPTSVEDQNRLAKELVQWAYLTDSYKIEEFPIVKRYNPYRFFKIRHTNEEFAEALELAKYILALRLEEEMEDNKNKKDYTLALKKYPLYHREYKEYLDSRLPERKDILEGGIQVVELEKYPSSPLVPEKKDNEHSS